MEREPLPVMCDFDNVNPWQFRRRKDANVRGDGILSRLMEMLTRPTNIPLLLSKPIFKLYKPDSGFF